MPVSNERPPIQLTEVPLNVNVACAPAVFEIAADPPLNDGYGSERQPAV